MVAVSYGDYGDYGLVTQAEFWKLCRHNIPHDTDTHTAAASVRIVSYLLWLRAGPLPRICRSSWWSAAALTAPSPCWIAAAGANTDHYHRHLVTAEIVPRVRSSLLTAACPDHVSRMPRVRITCPQCVSPLSGWCPCCRCSGGCRLTSYCALHCVRSGPRTCLNCRPRAAPHQPVAGRAAPPHRPG